MISNHPLREKLTRGEFVIGPLVNFNSPWFVDLAGLIGFDHVMIDAEHGPMGPEGIETMVRAAEAAGMSAAVRVPANVPHEILRYLDIGAVAIQVPRVDSAAEARAAVAAVKYPPMGARGLAAITRAGGYGVDQPAAAYVDLANRETVVLAMIESEAGVENVDAILAVDGIDALVIGPGDLSASMGHKGDRTPGPVERAVDHVIARAKARGKPVSLPASDAAGVQACRRRGAGMVQFTPAPWLVQSGRALMEAVRSQ